MKKYNYLLLLSAVAGTLSFASCSEDHLDIPQKGVGTSVDEFYKTDEDALAALAKVYVDTHKNFAFIPDVMNEYNFGPYMALTNFQSDDFYFAGSGSGDCVQAREFHDFRYTPSLNIVAGAYSMLYRSIHKCNLITNFVEGDTPTKKRCIAEARAMRAFDHLLLAIYWGKPILLQEVLDADAQPVNDKSQKEVLEWVVSEIDAVIDDLDERKSPGDAEGSYKITKGFAWAVQGKAYLWLGEYAQAKTALKKVISSGKYELLPGDQISKIMHADGRGSSESVFEFNYVWVEGTTSDWSSRSYRTNCNGHMTFNWRWENFYSNVDERFYHTGWGWINPTAKFCEDLIANDGMDSYRRKAWIITWDELINDSKWEKESEKGLMPKKVCEGLEGYLNWKTVMHPLQGDLNGNNDGQVRNFPIMRYAEVLLMYAEACAQLGETSGDGLAALNEIQKRAGSQTISSTLSLNAVTKEKQFELWMEGCRSADLKRWGDVASLKTADFVVPSWTDHGLDMSNADYYKKTYGATLGYKDGKDEFLPFPQKAIDLNKGLIQNPGWE